MPNGTELLLGISGKALIAAAASVGLTIDFEREDGDDYLRPEAVLDEINAQLKKVFIPALADIGITERVAPGGLPAWPDDMYFQTPAGIRRLNGWGLGLYYDPGEMAEEPKHAVLGVLLISRYFPTFLDWRSEYGGSGDVVELDQETLANIEIARKHLVPVLPFLKDAPIIFKEMFY